METKLPLPFLPSVDLGREPLSTDGLTGNQLSYLGCVYLAANNSSVDKLLQFLQSDVSIEAYVDVRSIDSIDDVVSILDSGARKVFVNAPQLKALKSYGERVLPALSALGGNPSDPDYKEGLLFSPENFSAVKPALENLTASKVSPIFLLASEIGDFQASVEIAKEFSAIAIIPATQLSVDNSRKELISVPAIIGSSWTSDRPEEHTSELQSPA